MMRAVKKGMFLASPQELDLKKTFECGQCFRWNEDPDGGYTGVVRGHAARVWNENGAVYIDSSEKDFEDLWKSYFHLECVYSKICFPDAGDYFSRCAAFGAGIRILRQEPWETLCSFIISQCNNIPRIKKIIETLSREFGTKINYRGQELYTFPDAGVLSFLSVDDLAPLRCGYRASYILSAAKAVASGELDLEAVASLEREQAIKALCSQYGVGKKVACCVVLYGLGMMSGFPIDVWMKRALKENFPPGFDPCVFGQYAGLAQQYIFYYARSMGKREKQLNCT